MRKPFGEILLEEGVINREELEEVLKIKEKSPLRIGQIIQKRGLAEEADVLRALANQYGYKYEAKLSFHGDPIFDRVPRELIERNRVIPIQKKGKTVTVAVANPSEIHAMDDIRQYLKGHKVNFVMSSETEIMRIIHANFQQASATAEEVMEGLGGDEYADLDSLSEDTMDLANEAPIIRMVNAILSQGVQERASDIHIEPYEKTLEIRYRIDGILHRRLSPPRMIHAGVVSRIKIMANMNIAENRLPQDGRIKIKLSGKEVDIRVSTIPTRYGERVVMRLLNKTDVKFSLQTLGFYPDVESNIRRVISEPNGIILVTGPTGSGKSTTLYAVLSELNQSERNIMTAEDPVEYEIPGVSQTQVQEKIGLTFAHCLRTMLRQDPDIIMVGEIRDQDTARIAIQAALTGHLVLSTLHTNDAPAAVTRLIDMGIEPYLITSTVRAVVAQRLVRVICPHCKTTYKPPAGELKDLGISPAQLKKGVLYRGEGCDQCVGTGYQGRNGLYEFMEVDTQVQRAILQGKDSEQIREAAEKEGMLTLLDYGRRKVIDGLTTPEEVLRVS
ncbi:MAG: type II secretion system ATPase GspE [Leptospiraceae bacterium]|nr:type II secretion system ATPase GspE [Leptospiraceae bacterium]